MIYTPLCMSGFIYMFIAVSLKILRNEYTVSFFTYQAVFHGISWNDYWTHETINFKVSVFVLCNVLLLWQKSTHSEY